MEEKSKTSKSSKKQYPRWVTIALCAGIIFFLPLALGPESLREKICKSFIQLVEGFLRSVSLTVVLIIAFLAMMIPEAFSAATYDQQVLVPNSPLVSASSQSDTNVYMFDTLASRNLGLSGAISSVTSIDSYQMVIPMTSIVNWSTNGGIVYVTTTSGGTYPVANLSQCGAVILGGVLIIVAGTAVWKLAKCAIRLLYKTNAPPTNAPPPGNNTFTGTGNSLGAGTSLNLPEGSDITFVNMDNNVAMSGTSGAGWTDWESNLITAQFSVVISPTNMSVGTKFCHLQSNTNGTDPNSWTDESLCVTGWVSSASGYGLRNAITITYSQGYPIGTNWYRLESVTNTSDSLGVLLGTSRRVVPQRTDSQLFFRTEAK